MVEKVIGGVAQAVVLSDSGISQDAIPARLIYQPMADGRVRLAWELVIYELSGENWWAIRVDAVTGQLLYNNNFIVQDNWDTGRGAGQSSGLNVPLVASAVFNFTTEGEDYFVFMPGILRD